MTHIATRIKLWAMVLLIAMLAMFGAYAASTYVHEAHAAYDRGCAAGGSSYHWHYLSYNSGVYHWTGYHGYWNEYWYQRGTWFSNYGWAYGDWVYAGWAYCY